MPRMKTAPRRWPLLLLLLCACVPVRAEIWRWTDAEGRVHFGDRAPQGAQAQRLEAPAAASPDPELARHRERSRKLLEVWDAERRARNEAAATAAAETAGREQACAELRAELARARQAAYLVRRADDGARQILGGAERAQYETTLADAIAAHCR